MKVLFIQEVSLGDKKWIIGKEVSICNYKPRLNEYVTGDPIWTKKYKVEDIVNDFQFCRSNVILEEFKEDFKGTPEEFASYIKEYGWSITQI